MAIPTISENIDVDDTTPTPTAKALEYQLIDLMSEPDIDDSVKQSIWSLVQYLTARQENGRVKM